MTTVSRAGPIERLLLDFAPLAVFFIGNATRGIFVGTGAFMAATAVAMIASRLRVGRVSPMLWFSGAMVLVFGGLTLWLHNETFIKVKPTIYYVTISGALFVGMATGRPMLKVVLEGAYPDLSERGWQLLSRNWAWFFAAMAVGNEIARRLLSTDVWVLYKLWGVMPATVLFAAVQLPLMMRHGLKTEADGIVPPPGD